MQYERAGTKDIEQLAELRLAYLLEDNGGLRESDLRIISRELPGYFARNLNQAVYGYVAREEGEIVACALLLVVEKPASPAFLTGKTGCVLNVYTKPAYRRQGHGRKLMEMLMSDAIQMDLSVVELKATQSGRKLYEALGFQEAASKYCEMKWKPGGRI